MLTFHTQNASLYCHFKEVSISTEIRGTESRWWFQLMSLMRSSWELWDLLTSTFLWVAEKPIHHNSVMAALAPRAARKDGLLPPLTENL